LGRFAVDALLVRIEIQRRVRERIDDRTLPAALAGLRSDIAQASHSPTISGRRRELSRCSV
jgi:hypothetical protein